MSKKTFFYIAIFCLSIFVIYTIEIKPYIYTNEHTEPFNDANSEDPILIANNAWRHFVGDSDAVNEKLALEETLRAIKLIGENGNKELIDILNNNISVFYSCSIDSEVRNIRNGDNLRDQYLSERSKENLIWSIFLRRIKLEENIDDVAHDVLALIELYFPSHPVKKYMGYLGGKLPKSPEIAYKVLKSSALRGDPDAAMHIGYKYECGFETIDIDEAMKWYEIARKIYEKDENFDKAISSFERINRLMIIKEQNGLI